MLEILLFILFIIIVLQFRLFRTVIPKKRLQLFTRMRQQAYMSNLTTYLTNHCQYPCVSVITNVNVFVWT